MLVPQYLKIIAGEIGTESKEKLEKLFHISHSYYRSSPVSETMPHIHLQNLETDVQYIWIKHLRRMFHGFENLHQGGGRSQRAY